MTKHVYTLLTVLLITIPFLHSCKGDENKDTEEYYEQTEASATEEVTVNEEETLVTYIKEEDYIFPTSGRTIENFVPPNSIYEIIDKAEGDLNGDDLDDLVLLLKHKYDVEGSSPVLVLFKNADNTYILKEMSRTPQPRGADLLENTTCSVILFENDNASGFSISAEFALRGGLHISYIYNEGQFVIYDYEISGGGAGGYTYIYKYWPLIGKREDYDSWYDHDKEEQLQSEETKTEKSKRILFTDPLPDH